MGLAQSRQTEDSCNLAWIVECCFWRADSEVGNGEVARRKRDAGNLADACPCECRGEVHSEGLVLEPVVNCKRHNKTDVRGCGVSLTTALCCFDERRSSLLVAKSGPRMQTGELPPPSPPGEQDPGPKPIENAFDQRGVEINGHGATMGRLASVLESWLRRSVIDQTGLTGTFNFDLKFHGMLSDMSCRTCLYSDSTPPSAAPDDGSTWPPVETAIQVLGLELKSTKAPQKVAVIDHIEMPSSN